MSVTRSEMNEVNETLAKHEALIESLGKKIEENDKKANARMDRLEEMFKNMMEKIDHKHFTKESSEGKEKEVGPTDTAVPADVTVPTDAAVPTRTTRIPESVGPTQTPQLVGSQGSFPRAEFAADTLGIPTDENTLPGPRDTKGRLNIHGHFDSRFRFCNETLVQASRVRQVWPQLISENDLFDHEARNNNAKNRSVWTDKHKMKNTRDPQLLRKLELVQAELRDTLVPYKTWPTRILPLLEEDFVVVARFIRDYNPSWSLAVEAILTRLDRSGALDHPWFVFTSLRPSQGEVYHKFANRLRDAVYNLPESIREDRATRAILCTIAQNYLPRAWITCEEAAREWTCYYLADRLCEIAKHVDRGVIEEEIYSRPEASVALQGKAAPFHQLNVAAAPPRQARSSTTTTATTPTPQVIDPLVDDVTITTTTEQAAAVQTGKCYNCGQPGHYAPDCRQKKRSSEQSPSANTITFRGTASFARNLTKRLADFRDRRNKYVKNKGKERMRGGGNSTRDKKVHYAVDESDEAAQDTDEYDDLLTQVEEETYNAIVDDYLNAAAEAHEVHEG